MTATTVSTSLVHPATIYRLSVGSDTWDYGHPTRWAETETVAAINIDPGEPRTLETERARADFWEYVADAVVWPSGADMAERILRGAKLAEMGRAREAAGHIDLF